MFLSLENTILVYDVMKKKIYIYIFNTYNNI